MALQQDQTMLPGRFRDNATGPTSRAYVACAPRRRLMMMLVLLRVAALLPLLSWASAPAQEALEQDLTALCEAKIARDRIPGLSCAAFVGDRMVFARGFGRRRAWWIDARASCCVHELFAGSRCDDD